LRKNTKGIKEKSDDRKNKKKRMAARGEVSQRNSQQKHCLDGVIGGTTRNTGTAWTEIGGNRRERDPWKEKNWIL